MTISNGGIFQNLHLLFCFFRTGMAELALVDFTTLQTMENGSKAGHFMES